MPQPPTLAVIFHDRPHQWGLRGDPELWHHLEKQAVTIPLPISNERLEEFIHTCYRTITGHELTKNSAHHVPAFGRGGMSSGVVSGRFWIEVALPLLKSRLAKAQQTL